MMWLIVFLLAAQSGGGVAVTFPVGQTNVGPVSIKAGDKVGMIAFDRSQMTSPTQVMSVRIKSSTDGVKWIDLCGAVIRGGTITVGGKTQTTSYLGCSLRGGTQASATVDVTGSAVSTRVTFVTADK